MLNSLGLRAGAAFAFATAAASAAVYWLTGSTEAEVIVTAALSGSLGLLIIGYLMRPLRRMTELARALAAGDFGARISPRPPGELGDLADAFNQMARGIEELITSSSQEQNRLMAALNSSVDAVLAVDAEMNVRFANSEAERFFQKTREQMTGKPFVWALANESVVEALRASVQEGRREIRAVEMPGRQYLQAVSTPILGGGDWSALVVFHDISDVRRVDQIRRDFVANVSHELRTPLASIKAVLETLEDGAINDAEAAADFLRRADSEIDRLVQLVEELLELSRIESGEAPLEEETIDVADLIRVAVDRLQPQAEKLGIHLSCVVSPALPSIRGDPVRLERALLNLVQNALKFTPAGGEVWVKGDVLDEEQGVLISVKDTGAGIDRRDLPRIFERFYKADHSRQAAGGSGLGLALVKHTIEAHGGRVNVDSTLGQGSIFSIVIPVSPSMPSKPVVND